MVDNYSKVLDSSRIGRAINYTYSLLPKLSRYVLNGKYNIDNNLIENTIRPLCIGRKNYLFCGNDLAATRASIIYSLIGSCKAANINPTQWLQYVLDNLDNYQEKDIKLLLPKYWQKEQ